MTRREVIVGAIAKEISWIQAAWICGITERHMRRLKEQYLAHGYDGLADQRGGRARHQRIAVARIAQLCAPAHPFGIMNPRPYESPHAHGAGQWKPEPSRCKRA